MNSIDDIFAKGTVQQNVSTYSIGEDWSQGRTVFGGMIAALANFSMRRQIPQARALRAMQVVFVGPGMGELQFESRILRIGKAVTLADCTVRSQGEITATISAVYGDSRESALSLQLQPKVLQVAPDDLSDTRPNEKLAPSFVQHFVQRWAVGAPPYSGANAMEMSTYVRHRNATRITESHIVALLDAIPSPALSMLKKPAPASTLTWNIEFLEHDYDYEVNRWWRLDAHVDATRDGYVNHVCNAIDPRGRVAAVSRQIVVVYG